VSQGDETHHVHEDPVRGVSRSAEGVVLDLVGELDLYNAPALREALGAVLAERPERVVLDLRDVTFLDSTVLGVLVEAGRELGDDGSLALVGVRPETRRALDVSGLLRRFRLHATVEEALR
jgi:anti-sigma B factor antagonist